MHQELLHAVKERLELGYSHDAIRDELRSAGHGEDTVETVLRQAQAELHPTATEVPHAASDSPDDAAPEEASGPDPDSFTSEAVGLIGYGALLSESWELFKQNIGLFTKAILLAVLLFAVVMGIILGIAFNELTNLDTLGQMGGVGLTQYFIGFLVMFIIGGVAFRILGFSVLRNLVVAEQQTESFRSSLKWTTVHIIPVLVLGLMTYLATQFGYALLVIPGIAMAIYLLFASYILAQEEGRYLSAMVRSTELVYGRWWAVFGRMLVAGIVAVLILIGLMIAAALVGGAAVMIAGEFLSAFIVPLGILFAIGYMLGYTNCVSVTLFRSLQASEQPDTMSAKGKKNLRVFYIIAVVLGIFAAVFVQGSSFMLDDLTQAQQAGQNALVQQMLGNARSQAEIYYNRPENAQSYAGVCSEIEPAIVASAKYSDCLDAADSWALSATADSGDQFCADSESSVVRGPVSVETGLCENSGVTADAAAKERANELRNRAE